MAKDNPPPLYAFTNANYATNVTDLAVEDIREWKTEEMREKVGYRNAADRKWRRNTRILVSYSRSLHNYIEVDFLAFFHIISVTFLRNNDKLPKFIMAKIS